ncbi:MAG: ATP synthase F1 subunit gamma [Anaerolineae bacterium]|nr:ATP synthase F1 subunit gamma [Anaerolineae bacterium]
MATPREIKRRIRSVKNIRQITMALEAVSASRVRRATADALRARAYANLSMEMLVNIATAIGTSGQSHPLLSQRSQVKTISVVLVTSDRGLSGAYNANIIRVARQFTERYGKPVRWIAVGRKGRDMLFRMRQNIVAEFTGLPPWWSISHVRPIVRVVQDEFLGGYSDEVFVAYTDFVNTLTQRPRLQRFLPLAADDMTQLEHLDFVKLRERPAVTVADYIYEPNASAILDEIVPKFVENILFELLLESAASEHSARMVAMRNASENAKALSDDLQLSYNKARQAAITGEILDIVGGVEAMGKRRESHSRPRAGVEPNGAYETERAQMPVEES